MKWGRTYHNAMVWKSAARILSLVPADCKQKTLRSVTAWVTSCNNLRAVSDRLTVSLAACHMRRLVLQIGNPVQAGHDTLACLVCFAIRISSLRLS